MAKRIANKADNTANNIFDLVASVNQSAEILSESKTAVIKDYISSGSYILNAAMTGSIFRGAPTGKVVTLAGNPGTGKSFLAISICREGQKRGYTPIYMDSEGAIDIDFVKRLGCDPTNFIIMQVTTIDEVSTFMANILKKINAKPDESRDKVIFVLDSLGNLTSEKELTDTIEANQKRDMTKQQAIKALFRCNATALAKAQSLMVVCSHVYQTLDLFSKRVISGGSGINYNSSVTLMLSTSKLDDKESDKIAEKKVGEFTKTGVIVTAVPEKSRYTIPQKVQFQVPFFKSPNPYVGLEKYLTWEHDGIMEGILISDKEYSKLSTAEKEQIKEFDYNGNTLYAFPKIAGIQKNRKIVVKHLGEELSLAELWTSKVLTDDLLHKLDDDVIKPLFELPSRNSFDDIDEIIETGTCINDNEICDNN
jgi:RecA/RadA recombinase